MPGIYDKTRGFIDAGKDVGKVVRRPCRRRGVAGILPVSIAVGAVAIPRVVEHPEELITRVRVSLHRDV